MGNLLYLVHRLPYPPNKGDKLRSYHLLKHLVAKHRVYLGTFIDDPEDEAHVAILRALCAEVHVVRLNTRLARFASLTALVGGEALSLRYYRDAGLARWVRHVATEHRLDACVVFSSPVAQYARSLPHLPMLVDFVDVDSAKWTEYAEAHRWPMSWLYRREGERLLAYERQIAAAAKRSFFVTEKETALFRGLAPECANGVEALGNGVDADYFQADAGRASPFSADEIPLVFTGAMDYWPNIDAVTAFVHEVLPGLIEAWPALRFHIVGRNPSAAVQALAGPNVAVSGTVADVRPYLQHAVVVVAPLRLARGLQNKILEAMAMARPVVASQACADAIDAEGGRELLAAAEPGEMQRHIDALLRSPDRAARVGAAGRRCVVDRYSWEAHLCGIDRYLERPRLAVDVRQAA